MKIANRAARRYLRAVRTLLPTGRMKRQLMAQLSVSMQSFLEKQPQADAAALQAQFGAPQDIAASYGKVWGPPSC